MNALLNLSFSPHPGNILLIIYHCLHLICEMFSILIHDSINEIEVLTRESYTKGMTTFHDSINFLLTSQPFNENSTSKYSLGAN